MTAATKVWALAVANPAVAAMVVGAVLGLVYWPRRLPAAVAACGITAWGAFEAGAFLTFSRLDAHVTVTRTAGLVWELYADYPWLAGVFACCASRLLWWLHCRYLDIKDA